MRISDWSSDVCSSDLPQRLVDADEVREARRQIDVPATIFALLPTLIGSHRDIAEQHRRLRVGHAPVIEEPDRRALHSLHFRVGEAEGGRWRCAFDGNELHSLPLTIGVYID